MAWAKTKYNYIVRMSLVMNLAPEKRKRFRLIEGLYKFLQVTPQPEKFAKSDGNRATP
jgi:hypothetical protein